MQMNMHRLFPDRLQKHVELWSRSARMIGLKATTLRTLEKLLRDRSENDRSFDARHGTDTVGKVMPAALGIADAVARTQAVVYLPSPARVTRFLLDAVNLRWQEWSFVDLGSGKGRVALVAAERPFKQVLGVELSPHLHESARANLMRYRGPADLRLIRFQLEDARNFALPEGDTVFHLYHPFGAPILREVLRRIEASQRERPRRIRIVYLGAFMEAMIVFAEFRFLKQTSFNSCLEPKYVWALFENV